MSNNRLFISNLFSIQGGPEKKGTGYFPQYVDLYLFQLKLGLNKCNFGSPYLHVVVSSNPINLINAHSLHRLETRSWTMHIHKVKWITARSCGKQKMAFIRV